MPSFLSSEGLLSVGIPSSTSTSGRRDTDDGAQVHLLGIGLLMICDVQSARASASHNGSLEGWPGHRPQS